MSNTAKKKKLLIAVHRMNVGGVQKSLLSALRVLDYDRYDVTLYVRQDRCDLLSQADPRVGRIIVNDDVTRYYRQPRAILYALALRLLRLSGRDTKKIQEKLAAYICRRRMRYEKKRYFSDDVRYDVAVAYIQGETAAFVRHCVPADRKIMFFHGSTDESHALHEEIFPFFDKIAAVNSDCRDILQKLYPAAAEKITFVDNYVDVKQIRRAAAEADADRGGRQTVLCTCGRFTPVKGFALAVKAAALLRDSNVDFLWYFAGDGPEREALQAQIIDLSLSDQIRITGFLQNPYPYIAGCDIYVQPSFEEAQPMAVMEAQILCRPVVTTETVGGKRLVKNGETGLIAAVCAEDIAEKIERLAQDAELCRQIRSALSETDFAREEEEYRRAWAQLLRF